MRKKVFAKMVKTILANGVLDSLSMPSLRIYHYGDMELAITYRFITIYKKMRVQKCYKRESVLSCDLKDGYVF